MAAADLSGASTETSYYPHRMLFGRQSVALTWSFQGKTTSLCRAASLLAVKTGSLLCRYKDGMREARPGNGKHGDSCDCMGLGDAVSLVHRGAHRSDATGNRPISRSIAIYPTQQVRPGPPVHPSTNARPLILPCCATDARCLSCPTREPGTRTYYGRTLQPMTDADIGGFSPPEQHHTTAVATPCASLPACFLHQDKQHGRLTSTGIDVQPHVSRY